MSHAHTETIEVTSNVDLHNVTLLQDVSTFYFHRGIMSCDVVNRNACRKSNTFLLLSLMGLSQSSYDLIVTVFTKLVNVCALHTSLYQLCDNIGYDLSYVDV